MTTTTAAQQLQAQAQAAKAASRTLARLTSAVKDRALLAIAAALEAHAAEVLAANERDWEEGRRTGLREDVLDRLRLNPSRLDGIAQDVRNVVLLPDPVGEAFDVRVLPNGLQVGKRRAPLGVVGCIYESRPNVTVDISSLCLKSGNATILRGGKEAVHTNTALAGLVRRAIAGAGVPADAVQFVESTDRSLIDEMLKMRGLIDLMVPRGGAELIRRVADNARMPVLTGGTGVCHTYVDRSADLDKAVRVVHNAKCRKFSICNALDTVLVHAEIAQAFLPSIGRMWADAGVEMRCDQAALEILRNLQIPRIVLRPASPEDFGREFLALVAAVKVVRSLDEALEHIDRYGTGHSDAIITEDYTAAMRFVDEVDTAVAYVNASTQFTDGAQFGMGAEIIDSTQKTIARGPVGLREITTYKWVVLGNGQVRP